MRKSILRQYRTRGWSSIPNDVTRDGTLSLRARGLLVLLLSFPDDWAFSLAHIQRHYVPEGLWALRTAMKELMARGYVQRGERRRGEDGRVMGFEYTVRDTPLAPATIVRFPIDGEPHDNED